MNKHTERIGNLFDYGLGAILCLFALGITLLMGLFVPKSNDCMMLLIMFTSWCYGLGAAVLVIIGVCKSI